MVCGVRDLSMHGLHVKVLLAGHVSCDCQTLQVALQSGNGTGKSHLVTARVDEVFPQTPVLGTKRCSFTLQ